MTFESGDRSPSERPDPAAPEPARDIHPEPHGTPSGLPEEQDDQPLGVERADPEGEGTRRRGAEAMPGIPTEGEPPSAG